LFLFPIKSSKANGTTYYVDNTITDTNPASATPDCTNYNLTTYTCSGGSASAFATIADINAFSALAPGDSVLFRRGQTWREQLTVPSSGSAGNPITFGAYGSGADPIINGTDIITGWTEHLENILTNGDFEDWADPTCPDGWSKEGTHDASNYVEESPANKLHIVSDGTWTGIVQGANLIQGVTYSYSIKVDTVISGSIKLRFGGTSSEVVIDSVGTHTGQKGVGAGDTRFFVARNVACDIVVDEVIVSPPNLWKATVTTEPGRVWFDGTVGTKRTSLATVTAAGDWYWAGGVLYIYSTSDPDTAFTNPGVEVTTATAAINTNAKSYVTIDGIDLQKATNGVYVSVADATTPSNITVQNCTISDVDLSAVLIGDTIGTHVTPSEVTIANNTFTNWHRKYPGPGSDYALGTIWAPALYVLYGDGSGGDNLTVSSNTFTSDITGNDSNQYRNGIAIYTGDNLIISGNIITGADHGIQVSGPGTANGYVDTYTITRNYIHDTADDAIWLAGVQSTDSLTAYNLLVANGDQGIATQACGTGSYGTIANNTIDSSYYCSILFIYGIGSTNLQNNIITNYGISGSNADPTNGKVVAAVCLSTGTTNLGSGTVDNNIYYKSGNSTPFYELTLAARTLTQWKSDMSKDASSLNSDPLFVDAANYDFHLQSGSPCINSGTPVSLTEDYAGNTVPNSAWPDIGAYEYSLDASTYYVDATSGDNSNHGTDSDNPVQTIARINEGEFSAGDTIYFKRGETWAEQLTVPSSGTSGNPITFSAYGSGTSGPTIDAGNTRDYGIDTNSQDYIVLEKLRVIGGVIANVLLDGANQTDLNYSVLTDGEAGVKINSTGSKVQNCTIYNNAVGIDVDAAGWLKNSILWNNTDDLDETGASINKLTNHIGDDGKGNPRFDNAANNDFSITGESPCRDKGTLLGFSSDFLGNPVPDGSLPDIGAYEYQTPALGTPLQPRPGPNGFKVIINNNDETTNQREVSLTFEAGSNVRYVAVSETPNFRKSLFSPTAFQSFKPGTCRTFTLSEGEGTKTVYAMFATSYGTFSDIVSDSIILDTTENTPSSAEATEDKEENSETENQNQEQEQEEQTLTSDLIRASDNKVYRIINNKKHWIPNPEVFNDYGYDWNDIQDSNSAQLADYFQARLLRPQGDYRVYYLTEAGMVRHIPSPEVFNSYNNKWEDIIEVSQKEINSYPINNLIRLENGIKVYKIADGIKRWIKTAEVFNRLKYDWNKIAPVNRTELDYYEEGKVIE